MRLTFSAAAALYLQRLGEIGGKDYVNNEQHLRSHLVPYLGTMRLDNISTFTLQKFQRHCHDKSLADATVNRVLATYRRMTRRLVEWGVVRRPPPMVRLRREDNRRTYVITAEEEGRLLDAALTDENAFVWLFVKLGLATGLRHSELLRTRFEHLDAVRRRLGVRVKGGGWREQPLTRSITAVLEHERPMAQDADG